MNVVRVPTAVLAMAASNLAEAQRIATTLQGITTLQALEAAERAVMRSPTKADLRMAIRGVAALARQECRREPVRSDPFAIPA